MEVQSWVECGHSSSSKGKFQEAKEIVTFFRRLSCFLSSYDLLIGQFWICRQIRCHTGGGDYPVSQKRSYINLHVPHWDSALLSLPGVSTSRRIQSQRCCHVFAFSRIFLLSHEFFWRICPKTYCGNFRANFLKDNVIVIAFIGGFFDIG